MTRAEHIAKAEEMVAKVDAYVRGSIDIRHVEIWSRSALTHATLAQLKGGK